MEERSLAILANYEPVQKEVEKFYSSNPNLITKIPYLIKLFELKSKYAKQTDRQNYKKDISFNTDSLSDDKSILEEHTSNEKDQKVGSPSSESHSLTLHKAEMFSSILEEQMEEDGEIDGSVDQPSIEEFENDSVKNCSILHEVRENEDSSEKSDIESDDSNCISDSETCEIPKVSGKKLLKNINKKSVGNHVDNKASGHIFKPTINRHESKEISTLQTNKPNSFIENNPKQTESHLRTIAVLNLAELDGLDEIPIGKETENEELEDEVSFIESSKMSRDPFFLKPGESPPIPDKKTLEMSPQKRDCRLTQQGGKKMNRYERRHGQPKPRPFDPETKSNSQNNVYRGSFQSQKEMNFNSGNRMKDFISKGVKGQNHFESSSLPTSLKMKETTFSASKRPDDKDKNIPEKLHPSWEAKRKQKQLAQTPFQGKKVVFDD